MAEKVPVSRACRDLTPELGLIFLFFPLLKLSGKAGMLEQCLETKRPDQLPTRANFQIDIAE